MAGISNPNLPTYYVDSVQVTAREAEAQDTSPDVDFAGGMNKGGSNAPGMGVNTGDYSPKDSDWPEVEQLVESNQIGDVASGLFCEDATFGDTALVGFAPALQLTANDAVINNDVDSTGFANVNRTGADIPDTMWAWGPMNNP